jgi:subtilisin-like proprotein convertase family protein
MRHCDIVPLLASLPVALLAFSCTPSLDDCERVRCSTRLAAVTHAPMTAAQSFKAVAYAVSARAADLPPFESKPGGDPERAIEEKAQVELPTTFRVVDPGSVASQDAVVQRLSVEPTLDDPGGSFDGLSNQNNPTGLGSPRSDTNGDVGPGHFVETTNLLVRVFGKDGRPLTPAFKLSSLFQQLGGQCAEERAGASLVLYDPLSDRWVLSQLAFVDITVPPYHECIAVSQTSDPTGAYFLFDFITPGASFPADPRFGVWSDAYYMTTNQFLDGRTFNGAGVFAFERAKLVAGDPTAAMVYVDLNIAQFPERIGGMLPADIDGLTPPPAGSPGVLGYFTANELASPTDAVRMFDFHVNFTVPSLSTFTERAESPVLVAPFNPLTPAGSTSDRLMFRLAYRNFGDHESVVATHGVNVGTDTTPENYQSGVRYYELRRAPGGPFAVVEQGSFAPGADSRSMPSGAMDHHGNLAVAYNAASSTASPSVRYAGRLATDPRGGLFRGERSLVGGNGTETGTGASWGDYRALNVDPSDDCTFWFTSDATASDPASSAGPTRIGRFRFAECVNATPAVLHGTVRNALTGAPIAGASVVTADGFLQFTGSAGDYSMTVSPRSYTMTASAFGFRSATVAVAAGGTTVQNLALDPAGVVQAAGSTLTRDDCTANGVIDPTEGVRVRLGLRNVGTADIERLQATLLPGGGVTNPQPDGLENYGSLVAGGPVVEREFAFTANATCGGTLTATLQLRDDRTGQDLGTASFSFPVGTLSPVASNASASTGGVAVALRDLATEIVPIDVTTTGEVVDLDVRIRANHTFDGDLTFLLIGPDGTTVSLSARNGGSGDNYGSGATDCSGVPTVFDDQAANSIIGATAPFAGSFRPQQPLARFNGRASRGTWKLQITDSAGADVGTLFCAQLVFKVRTQLCCDPNGTPIIVADTASLLNEHFAPSNGAADPGETVRFHFDVLNVGSGRTDHLKADLLDGHGVVQAEGQQIYGVVDIGGAPVGADFQFTADGVCGATIEPTLALHDGTLDLGTVSFPIQLGVTERTTITAAQPAPIAINDTPRVGGIAVASPYPSTIDVSGAPGTVRAVRVTLNGLRHTFPADIDIKLVGPQGQQVILLSDVGGGTDIVNVNLTLDDAAPAPVGTTVVSGTFQPTNIGAGDTFPGSPAGVPAAALAVFNGTDPNGLWQLFVVDDAGADRGDLLGGWSLSIDTEFAACVSPLVPDGGTAVPQGDVTAAAP